MRRPFAFLSAFALLAGLVPTAAANEPIRSEEHYTSVGCYGVQGEGIWSQFGVTAYDDGTVYGFLSVWVDGRLLTNDFDQPIVAIGDADSLDATIPLEDPEGNPAGTAVLAATMEPAGEPWMYDSYRSGNLWVRWSGQIQPLAVSGGTLTVGLAEVDLSSGPCSGSRTDLTYFQTSPRAAVQQNALTEGYCEASDNAGHDVFVGFNVSGESFVNAGFYIYEGEVLLASGNGSGELVDGTASVPIDVYDPATGWPTGDKAALDFSLSGTGERHSYTITSSTDATRVTGELLDFEGSLVIDGGYAFDLGPCIAYAWTSKTVGTYPSGPKPSGPVPANDLPSGAITLAPGSKAVGATKVASPDAEEGFECLSWVDENGTVHYDPPIGHTVWYAIQGTGGAITVDTAGSDYDTVAAVFTADGAGGWDPLPGACVDDVGLDPVGVSWQSAVTFPTVADTWYYVQIGGYPGQFGALKVAVR